MSQTTRCKCDPVGQQSGEPHRTFPSVVSRGPLLGIHRKPFQAIKLLSLFHVGMRFRSPRKMHYSEESTLVRDKTSTMRIGNDYLRLQVPLNMRAAMQEKSPGSAQTVGNCSIRNSTFSGTVKDARARDLTSVQLAGSASPAAHTLTLTSESTLGRGRMSACAVGKASARKLTLIRIVESTQAKDRTNARFVGKSSRAIRALIDIGESIRHISEVAAWTLWDCGFGEEGRMPYRRIHVAPK